MEEIILQAVKQGTPVETFERILAMKRQIKADEAKEGFDQAMANAQSEFPEIKKTKKAMDGQKVLYAYAPIDEIVNQVKGILSKNGLSYFIKTEMSEGKVKSICIVKHISGHSESSEMEVPLGNKTGIMSNSQQTAAAATFSKRYAFMNAFGIMTGDVDDESNLRVDDEVIEKAKEQLSKCMTRDELVSSWKTLSKELKANKQIISFANDIKSNIENEQKNK
jgi:hypothetical protein